MRIATLLFIALSLLFISCDDDPCEDTFCTENGTCINGQCVCADGFEGIACESQVTPLSIRVEDIVLTRYPATRADGTGWDPFDGPDLFMQFEYVEGSIPVVLFTSETVDNVPGGSIPTFNVTTSNIIIDNPLDRYQIRLLDRELFGSPEDMGGVSFIPYTTTNRFPEFVDASFGDFSFTFTLSYRF